MLEKDIRVNYLREIDPLKRLEIDLLGRAIPSPLILGSGTLIEKIEHVQPFLEAGVGAVVSRTTRKIMERQVHPSPHLYQTGRKGNEMMLNAEWTGAAIEYWVPFLEKMAEMKQVIMSVSGRNINDCVEVCKILDQFSFPMIEINISCAHSNSVHGFITRNGEHIRRIVGEIKEAGVVTPIGLKLGHSDYIVELAQIAKEEGVDAIIALNSFGPLFDFSIGSDGNPVRVLGIQGAKGGMSGVPLFQIALTDVAEIRRQVGIPVIGCGGVRTAEDVVKMMMAGAKAVQIYTAAHVKGIYAPSVFKDINSKLVKFIDAVEVEKIHDIRDRAQPLLNQETNLDPLIPAVVEEKCTGCDLCVPVCLPKAIDAKKLGSNSRSHVIAINERCIGCGHCVSVCPTKALEI